MSELEKTWSDKAGESLVGRTITGVRYMTAGDAEDLKSPSRSIVLELSAKADRPVDEANMPIVIWPSSDDEGNNGGALFSTDKELDTIPVI